MSNVTVSPITTEGRLFARCLYQFADFRFQSRIVNEIGQVLNGQIGFVFKPERIRRIGQSSDIQ